MNKDQARNKAKRALCYYLNAEYGDRAVEVNEIVDLIIAAAVGEVIDQIFGESSVAMGPLSGNEE